MASVERRQSSVHNFASIKEMTVQRYFINEPHGLYHLKAKGRKTKGESRKAPEREEREDN